MFDPYSYSLMRFTDVAEERHVCALSCRVSALPEYAETSADLLEALVTKRHASGIRVGYLSYDWRQHPMGRLTQHLVSHHSAEAVETTYLLSYGYDDGSALRRELIARAAASGGRLVWVELSSIRNDRDVSSVIASLRLDVLVDLTAHTYNGRVEIAAARPSASLVVNYLGFPGTTGCGGFDHAMVDVRVAPPEVASRGFSERMLYLPVGYQSTAMPPHVSLCAEGEHRGAACRLRILSGITMTTMNTTTEERSSQSQLNRSSTSNAEAEAEAEADDVRARVLRATALLCSFNAHKKFEPMSFGTWMSALRRVPGALLVLLSSSHSFVRRNIRAQAMSYGVSPSRILFVPNVRRLMTDTMLFIMMMVCLTSSSSSTSSS